MKKNIFPKKPSQASISYLRFRLNLAFILEPEMAFFLFPSVKTFGAFGIVNAWTAVHPSELLDINLVFQFSPSEQKRNG